MNRRTAFAVLMALAVAVVMLAELTRRRRDAERELRERVEAVDRKIDMGIVLRVVEIDERGGRELVPGAPPLRILREHRLGGLVDTAAEPAYFCGPSPDPVVWHCSADQEPIILHGDDVALGQLVYGSEGAGKTACLAMWHALRVLENLGELREGGATAPTQPRLEMIRTEIRKWWRPSWYSYKSSEDLYEWVDGSRVRLVSTHRQSLKEGSRVQGYSWSWASRDEAQDQIDVHEDIESRGRAAPNGRYKQLATATAKDSSAWRAYREQLLAAEGLWERRTLLGPRSPFVWPKFWEDKRRTMSVREYQRRVEAQDVAPELAVYHGWDRRRNLVAKPRIATDVTGAVLADYRSYIRANARFSMVAGHDPGNIFNTTTLWRLIMFGDIPTWVAVGELQTKQTTAQQHARALREYLQREFDIERGESSKAAIFCDPHGRGEAQTDYQAVYMAFQREGLDIFSAAPMTHRIKRSARVEMINRLLGDASGIARMVVGRDERGAPLAPVLVEAFESLEKRAGDEDPEGSQRKDASDRTHAPASAGYALWNFEQEAFTDRTQATARSAARRFG